MKNLKLKILEVIILLTIIISIIVIILFAKNALSTTPEVSTSNTIKNYSETKISKYSALIEESYIYNIPYIELINPTYSSYNKFITSTDNIINTYTEKILLKYNQLLPEQETFIQNYCNTYDIIELEYKFQCSYKNNTLSLSNQYNINLIDSQEIKNNHNITITIPIKKNTRLNEYIEELNKNNINTTIVDRIQ